jgi:hypothetical protein
MVVTVLEGKGESEREREREREKPRDSEIEKTVTKDTKRLDSNRKNSTMETWVIIIFTFLNTKL